MISQTVLDIERSISSLSVEEQLWLLERIACRVRQTTYTANKLANAKYREAEIAEMANDPEIQVEIAAIDREFIVAEMDGWFRSAMSIQRGKFILLILTLFS
jgi:hypothetical protein